MLIRGKGTSPDYNLAAESASWNDQLAITYLDALDYGGYTVVKVSHNGSVYSFPLPVPVNSANRLPQAGWKVGGFPVSPTTDHSDDMDLPIASIMGPLLLSGDGLTAFEEFRGFIALGQHIRLNPHEQDVFFTSEFLEYGQGVGYALNLPVRLHRLTPDQIGPGGFVNFNYQDVNGESIPGLVGQKAVRLVNALYHPASFGHVLNPSGSISTQFFLPPAGYGVTEIFPLRVMEMSPPDNSQFLPNSPWDELKLMQTLAHEFGHNVGLGHFEVFNACPVPTPTVMVDGYFQATFSNSQTYLCPWLNIPNDYRLVELQTYRLRY
jgi:hypothetical protein